MPWSREPASHRPNRTGSLPRSPRPLPAFCTFSTQRPLNACGHPCACAPGRAEAGGGRGPGLHPVPTGRSWGALPLPGSRRVAASPRTPVRTPAHGVPAGIRGEVPVPQLGPGPTFIVSQPHTRRGPSSASTEVPAPHLGVTAHGGGGPGAAPAPLPPDGARNGGARPLGRGGRRAAAPAPEVLVFPEVALPGSRSLSAAILGPTPRTVSPVAAIRRHPLPRGPGAAAGAACRSRAAAGPGGRATEATRPRPPLGPWSRRAGPGGPAGTAPRTAKGPLAPGWGVGGQERRPRSRSRPPGEASAAAGRGGSPVGGPGVGPCRAVPGARWAWGVRYRPGG